MCEYAACDRGFRDTADLPCAGICGQCGIRLSVYPGISYGRGRGSMGDTSVTAVIGSTLSVSYSSQIRGFTYKKITFPQHKRGEDRIAEQRTFDGTDGESGQFWDADLTVRYQCTWNHHYCSAYGSPESI